MCALIAAVASALLFQSRLSYAGAYDFNDSGWQGTSEFLKLLRAKLGAHRVVLAASIDYSKLTPRDAVIVLHPTVALHTEWLSEFMGRGGRVAVVDDYGSAGSFFEKFAIRRLNPPLRPSDTLRGNPNLAWAVPSGANPADGSASAPAHPIVDGLQRVLTNHPIVLSNSQLTPLLEIRSPAGDLGVLAYAGVIGKRGRLFAMGDPSVLINLMMRYPENRLFAERLATYLVADDNWGHREGLLYIMSNGFTESNSTDGDWFSGPFAARVWARGRDAFRGQLPEPVQWLLALLVASYLGHWTWSRMIRSTGISPPLFAVPIPLLGKPGESARAAVLASPTTPRALTLLELNAGMHSYLSAELDSDVHMDLRSLLEAIVTAGVVDETLRREFVWYMSLVNKVQEAIAKGRSIRVTLKELKRAHRLVHTIADRISDRPVVT